MFAKVKNTSVAKKNIVRTKINITTRFFVKSSFPTKVSDLDFLQYEIYAVRYNWLKLLLILLNPTHPNFHHQSQAKVKCDYLG